jgi:TldD protein
MEPFGNGVYKCFHFYYLIIVKFISRITFILQPRIDSSMAFSVHDIKRSLGKLIPVMEAGGCTADALYLRTETLSVNKDKTSVDVAKSEDEGVKLRVFDGQRYHERGVSGFDEAALRKSAKELGRVKKQRTTVKIDPGPPLEAEYMALGRINPARVPLKRKLVLVESLHRKVVEASKLLINVRVFYEDMAESKVFVSRHRKLSQRLSGCHVILIPFVKGVRDVRYHYKSYFGHGYEATKVTDRDLKTVVKFAERIAKAERLAPGRYLCLLSPSLTGLLAHESFGHGMEADTLFKGRALATRHIGKRIASSEISISDGPLVPNTHGFFFFDDEGWLATKTLMIEKGIIKLPITDAYNAAQLNVPRSSNGRLESFDHKVYARMTNTYFEPGKERKAAMLRRIKNGLYLHSSAGGMEDPKGWGIQIQGIIAEEVKDGKLTGRLYYEAGMTGYLPTVLKNILGVSKEFEIPGTGRCGKGHTDWVRVAEGGPYLLIKDVILS